MKIMEVKIVHSEGIEFVEPIRGFILFKHCSGGRKRVTNKCFIEVVKPLLLLHGVEEVKIL